MAMKSVSRSSKYRAESQLITCKRHVPDILVDAFRTSKDKYACRCPWVPGQPGLLVYKVSFRAVRTTERNLV